MPPIEFSAKLLVSALMDAIHGTEQEAVALEIQLTRILLTASSRDVAELHRTLWALFDGGESATSN